jgi:hypothetical protein
MAVLNPSYMKMNRFINTKCKRITYYKKRRLAKRECECSPHKNPLASPADIRCYTKLSPSALVLLITGIYTTSFMTIPGPIDREYCGAVFHSHKRALVSTHNLGLGCDRLICAYSSLSKSIRAILSSLSHMDINSIALIETHQSQACDI